MKRFIGILAIFALVLTMAACGSKESTESDAQSSDEGGGLTKVTYVSPTALESYDYLALYVGKYMGYFEDEGLDLELVEQVGTEDVKMVAAGTAQFAYPSPGVLMSCIDAGITNVIPICNYDAIQIFGIAVNRDAGINDWTDLAGKDIALYSEAWTALVSPFLDAMGMSLDEVNLVSYGDGRYEAVASGKAPALGTWLSEYYQLIGQGYEFDYLDGNEICPSVSNSLVTSKEFAEESPDTVRAFIRALTKSMYFCYLNEEAAADITLLTCPNLQIDWEGAKGAAKGDVMQIFGVSPEEQTVRLENIGMFDFVYAQNAADNLLKSGVIGNPIDVEDYYTNEFLDTSWDRAAIEADAAAYVCSSPAYKAANS